MKQETLVSEAKQNNHVNLIELSFEKNPLKIFTSLYKRSKYAYLLESIEGPEKLAQYSFIGYNPRLVISTRDDETTVKDMETGEKTIETIEDPFKVIKKTIKEYKVDFNKFRLVGGAVGYVSYDIIRSWEKLPRFTTDDLKFPDIEMGIYDDGIVFDHLNKEVYYYYTRDCRLNEILEVYSKSTDYAPLIYENPEFNYSKEDFEKAVARTKEYITAGDIFQAVLSKRLNFCYEGDLVAFYRTLRDINPSPYMYFLKLDDRKIIGSSPEMLVRVEGNIVDTFPIAGTRPNVADPAENNRLAEELLSDPKERAEHVMLVDLARNDIGKVSEYGSVHLPEFMTVHQYSHVQHIVTQVRGTIGRGLDSFDALKAVFPAGTVSGAPKVRAMEIIEELEPTKRGPYAGAVGYFSYNGNADFAITIRTLVADGEKASIQVGAGIVADSIPENEWFETDHKAAALLKALEASGGCSV
jgi:anthranilate synthase component 1